MITSFDNKLIQIYYYCSLNQNFGDTERIYKMSFSKPTGNGMVRYSVFKLNKYI